MPILFRNKNKKWGKLAKISYKNEAQLQNEIYNDPSILPLRDIDVSRKEICVFLKEFGLPGSGNSDIIGLDPEGRIYIIETKLATNAEAKREVIGQIFEYAGFLWKMSFEEFDQKVSKITSDHLVNLIKKRIKDKDWSEEQFLSAVSTNLEKGNFSLIVAVDQMNEPLKRIVDYINLSGSFHFELFALEIPYFTGQGLEVLTPRLYGVKPSQKTKTAYGSKDWTEKEYFKVLRDRTNEEIHNLIKNFYNKVKTSKNFEVWFSGGEKEGYIKVGVKKGNEKIALLSLANVSASLIWIEIKAPKKSLKNIDNLHKELFNELSEKVDLSYDYSEISSLYSKTIRLADFIQEQRKMILEILYNYLNRVAKEN